MTEHDDPVEEETSLHEEEDNLQGEDAGDQATGETADSAEKSPEVEPLWEGIIGMVDLKPFTANMHPVSRDILIWLHIPPMDAILFPGRPRPGKRIASIGRRQNHLIRTKF